jgi:uncharacterized phiE125 gp8 family phage protein
MPEPLRLILTARPAVEPVTLAQAKALLRVDPSDDDALIAGLITAARETCERFTRRALITQTWTLVRDDWGLSDFDESWPLAVARGAAIEIPRPPLRSVIHVKTYDDADAATVWPASAYIVDTASEPGRLIARAGAALPVPTRAAAGIEIRFIAGYAPDESASPTDPAGNVPASLIEGIKRLVVHLYENRGACGVDEAAALSGAALLWQPYQVARL